MVLLLMIYLSVSNKSARSVWPETARFAKLEFSVSPEAFLCGELEKTPSRRRSWVGSFTILCFFWILS